jgi:hypothetical protein
MTGANPKTPNTNELKRAAARSIIVFVIIMEYRFDGDRNYRYISAIAEGLSASGATEF